MGIQDYDKNRKPVVSVASTKEAFRLKDENLAPVTRPVSSKSQFSEKVLPTNNVSAGSSARLQQAGRLPGRVGKGGENKALSL